MIYAFIMILDVNMFLMSGSNIVFEQGIAISSKGCVKDITLRISGDSIFMYKYWSLCHYINQLLYR